MEPIKVLLHARHRGRFTRFLEENGIPYDLVYEGRRIAVKVFFRNREEIRKAEEFVRKLIFGEKKDRQFSG